MYPRYYTVIRTKDHIFSWRAMVVQTAQEKGISATARQFHTTRNTVRKWLTRYRAQGTKGLRDLPKTPRRSPKKIPKSLEDKILDIRRRLPTWGPRRLKLDFSIPSSPGAIYRVLKQKGFIRRPKRKYRRKRAVALIRKHLRAFGTVQVDVKELCDIPSLQEGIWFGKLPRYQYTARDTATGMLFLAYAHERSIAHSVAFLHYLARYLKANGGRLPRVTIQTDNGSEFIGSYKSKFPSAFTRVIESYRMNHRRIPPGCSNANAHVETSHRWIEDEFYDIDPPRDTEELLAKAYCYQIYFNTQRKNSNKGYKTPADILQTLATRVSPQVAVLPPVILDNLIAHNTSPGYHVPVLTEYRPGLRCLARGRNRG